MHTLPIQETKQELRRAAHIRPKGLVSGVNMEHRVQCAVYC